MKFQALKKWSAALVAVSAIMAAAACTGDGGNGGGTSDELRVAVGAEPPTMDWQSGPAAATQQAGIQIYETLYALDAKYEPVPLLAADQPTVSDDRLTYTIPLREGVTFHNGDAMDAEDVVASLKRWSTVSGMGPGLFDHVKSVDATSPTEVTLSLTERVDDLVRRLAVPVQPPVVMPSEIAERAGDEVIQDDKDIVGTGPYSLDHWARGTEYVLKRFTDYASTGSDGGGLAGKKDATFDTVTVSFIPEAATRLDAVETGQVDYALEVPGSSYERVQSSDAVQSVIVSPHYSYFAAFSMTDGPFKDREVREAARLAIDPEQVMESSFGSPDLYAMNGAIYPEGMSILHTDEGVRDYDKADLAAAKRKLAGSSYDGEEIVIVSTKSIGYVYDGCVVIAKSLEDAGFKVRVEVSEWADVVAKLPDPKQWDIFAAGYSIGYITPGTHLLLNGQFPYAGFYGSQGAIADLLTEWNTVDSPDQQTQLMGQIQTQFYHDVPAVKFGDFSAFHAAKASLDVGENQFFWPTWWDVRAG